MNPVQEITKNIITPICGKKVTPTIKTRCKNYEPTKCTWRCKANEDMRGFDWRTYLGSDDFDEMCRIEENRLKELNTNMDREEWSTGTHNNN